MPNLLQRKLQWQKFLAAKIPRTDFSTRVHNGHRKIQGNARVPELRGWMICAGRVNVAQK